MEQQSNQPVTLGVLRGRLNDKINYLIAWQQGQGFSEELDANLKFKVRDYVYVNKEFTADLRGKISPDLIAMVNDYINDRNNAKSGGVIYEIEALKHLVNYLKNLDAIVSKYKLSQYKLWEAHNGDTER